MERKEEVIIQWALQKHGKKRGYGMSNEERRKLTKLSDKVMQKHWEKWLIEKKREEEQWELPTKSQETSETPLKI